jgi:hypothetical protein
MRFELTAAQRGLWADLLALAGRSRRGGVIAAGKNGSSYVGYPLSWLAGTCNVSESEIAECLQRLSHTKRIKIVPDEQKNPVIFVSKWATYQSEYERQKPYREKKLRQPKGYNEVTHKVTDEVTRKLHLEGEEEGEGEEEEKQHTQTVPAKTIPPAVKSACLSLFGADSFLRLRDWLNDHDEAHILEAIKLTEAAGKGKRIGIAYCNGILQSWARDGYPETHTREPTRKRSTFDEAMDAIRTEAGGKT